MSSEGYRIHQPITSDKVAGVWCDGCNRHWPCEVVRAYHDGREDAAREVISAADDHEYGDDFGALSAAYEKAKEITGEQW